jgi:hypothetical protein
MWRHEHVSPLAGATLLSTKGATVDVNPEAMNQQDHEMMHKLREGIAELHPEPDNLVQLASGLFTLRTLDGDLAALAYDSTLDEAVSVRSPGVLTRVLSFESDAASFEIDLDEQRRIIIGQVIPPVEGTIELQHPEGSQTVDLGAVGSFEFRDVPVGPLRLRLVVDAQTVATTTFFTL